MKENNQHIASADTCEYVIFTVGDEFKHATDGRTVTVEDIRCETPEDNQRPNYAKRVELSNGNNVGDEQLATALSEGEIVRV